MKKLNDIFKIIDREKIILEEIPIQSNCMKGIYFHVPGIPPTIGIPKFIDNNRCRYLSILTEEVGHHFTTLGDLTEKSNNYSQKLEKNKKERKAKLWAANFLISDEDFVQALYNCISTRCDMCDYFNVTNEILNYKILSIICDEIKYNNIKNNLKLREIPYEVCAI